MTFKTTAALTALIAAAALAAPLSAANAHGKKHFHGFHGHNHGFIVIGSPHHDCWRWKRLYKKTGKKRFLHRYYACIL